MADDFETMAFGSGKAASATPDPGPAPADSFDKLAFGTDVTPSPTEVAAAAAAAPPPSGTTGAQVRGAYQGMQDVSNSLVNAGKWIDEKLPFAKRLDTALGIDPDALAARGTAARTAYEASPEGKSNAGQWGRFAGQVAGTLPIAAVAAPVEAVAGTGVGAAALSGALQGGLAGAATSSAHPEIPVGQQAGTGAILGGVLAPALRTVSNYLFPRVEPEVAQMAQNADQKFGVKLLPSQISNEGVPTGGTREQLQNFTKAATDVVGMSEDRITPATVEANRLSVGKGMDNLMGQHGLDATPDFGAKVDALKQQALDQFQPSKTVDQNGQVVSYTDTAERTKVLGMFARLRGAVSNARYDQATGQLIPGRIDGPTLQSMADSHSALGRDARSGSPTTSVSGDLLDLIHDQFEQGAGADAGKWAQLRKQYADTLALEKPAIAAGPTGVINPQTLQSVVKPGRGSADMEQLAQVGKFLAPPTIGGGVKASAIPSSVGTGAASAALDFAARNDPHEAALTGLATAGSKYLLEAARRQVQGSPALTNMLIRRALGQSNALSAAGAVAPVAAADLYNEPKVRNALNGQQ